MSPESLWIHPAALEEAEAATDWYSQRSRRAAERFLDELDSAVDHILQSPSRYPAYQHDTRRMVLRRFPFTIVFREITARLETIAIAHGRRNPGYWRDRLG